MPGRHTKMERVQAESVARSLLRTSAAINKHGIAIGIVSGLVTAAVGTAWFVSRMQARNEQAILEERRKREVGQEVERRERELGDERVQHEVKNEKLHRKVEEERVRREMLQRVLDISYHADWESVRERVSKKSGVKDDGAKDDSA